MTAIKWFRKNNKKLLAVFGVLLMVGFLIPSFTGMRSQGRFNGVAGYITDQNGQEVEIGLVQVQKRDVQLRVMRELGLNVLCQFDGQRSPLLCQLPTMGGVGPFPVIATSMLFFGDNQYALGVRNFLQGQAMNWAKDRQGYDRYLEYINELTASEAGRGSLYFLLLAKEAHRNGIYATDKQIDQVFEAYRQLIERRHIRPHNIQQVLRSSRMSETELKQAVGDYLAIVRYGDMVTRQLAVSEPQLRKKIRDQIEQKNVKGTYISFSADMFRDKTGEPSEDDLQKHFEKYKQFRPDEIDKEENPFGFGYLLPDRVQVEYLKVDLSEVEKIVTAEFAQLPAGKQEETLQQYWAAQKQQFRVPLPESEIDPCDAQAPRYRDPAFDEVYGKVKQAWQQQQSREKGQVLLAQARETAQKQATAMNSKKKNEGNSDKPEETTVEKRVDYEALAKKLSTDKIKIVFGKTEYISRQDLPQELLLGDTYKMRNETPQQSLLEILFACKPLHKGTVSRLDVPPMQLYEDITSLMAFDYRNPAMLAYMMRIVGVDPEREAEGLADDGRAGTISEKPLPESQLKTKVKDGWQNLQAYTKAKKQADKFAQNSEADWKKTFEETNIALKDPCAPAGMKPLREQTLETTRQHIEWLTQTARKYPEQSRRFLPQIAHNTTMLFKSMELAQEQRAEKEKTTANKNKQPAATRAILELPSQLNCMVFKDLQVTSPNQGEYLRRKPLATDEILRETQPPLTLVHYNPDNILKRSQFRENKPDEESVK